MRRFFDAMLSSPLRLPMSTAPLQERPDFPVSSRTLTLSPAVGHGRGVSRSSACRGASNARTASSLDVLGIVGYKVPVVFSSVHSISFVVPAHRPAGLCPQNGVLDADDALHQTGRLHRTNS